MPAVVSDSSPFVYLTRLGRFELLRVLYGQVLIPPAVWREVVIEGAGRAEAENVRQAAADGWLTTGQWPDGYNADPELVKLDDGEREAIALAHTRDALLIIDESRGREVAMRLGVHCTGTIGVLVEARLRSLIPDLRRELETLKDSTNFRLTEQLVAEALKKAGESAT
jgi:uncharacterized protein